MYDFTGLECPVCREAFCAGDDIVVCPECGAPHHRHCWQGQGRCQFEARHAAGYEWAPPQPEPAAQGGLQCPRCGTGYLQGDHFCRNCGLTLDGAPQQGDTARQDPGFDYSRLYNDRTYTPDREEPDDGLPKADMTATVDGIPMADWAAYIGPSNRLYLVLFHQMERLQRRATMSFSAMVFGPLYFAYRKAWKPALIFALLSVLGDAPAMLYLMHMTESVVTAGMNPDVLYRLSAAASVMNFAVMAVRGMYGFYWYKQSSLSAIRRIRANYPDDTKRMYVLRAQGGTSWVAVIAMILAWLGLCGICALLLGPNLDAVFSMM